MYRKLNIRMILLLEILAVSEPDYLTDCFPAVTTLWRALFAAGFFLLFADLVAYGISESEFRQYVIVIALLGVLVLTTILGDGAVKTAVRRLLYWSYCYILAERSMRRYPKEFLEVLTAVLAVRVIGNLVTVLIWPDGLYGTDRIDGSIETRHWLLGFKNGIGKEMVIAAAVSCLLDHLKGKKFPGLLAWILIAAAAIQVAVIKSSSGLVGIVLVTALLLIMALSGDRSLRVLRVRNLAILTAVLFFLLVVSNVLLRVPVVTDFIEQILHKDVTISNRIYIWENVLTIVRHHPLFGVGYQTRSTFARMIGVTANATDAHDYYLEFLLEGGACAFLGMVIFLGMLVIHVDRQRNNRYGKILTAGMFTLMIIFLTENCANDFLWIFYGIAGNVGCLTTYQRAERGLKHESE